MPLAPNIGYASICVTLEITRNICDFVCKEVLMLFVWSLYGINLRE